jgi:hypothetical protein
MNTCAIDDGAQMLVCLRAMKRISLILGLVAVGLFACGGSNPPAASPDDANKTSTSGADAKDTDGDGIPDSQDKCPDKKEDGQMPDPKDGCPKQ